MPRRFDLGRVVLLLGSALLFSSLFVRWYDTGPNGWEVFETLDLVLAGLAVAGTVTALRPQLFAPWVAGALPAAALVIVAVQLVNAPPAAGDADPSSGAWLALAGSLLMVAGVSLWLADISVTVQIRERELRRRTAAVDRRADAAVPGGALGDDPYDDGSDAAPPARGARRLLDDEDDRTQPLTPLSDGDEVPPERP